MSAGMKVQCSILESPVKNLCESSVKALNGNALYPACGFLIVSTDEQTTQSDLGTDVATYDYPALSGSETFRCRLVRIANTGDGTPGAPYSAADYETYYGTVTTNNITSIVTDTRGTLTNIGILSSKRYNAGTVVGGETNKLAKIKLLGPTRGLFANYTAASSYYLTGIRSEDYYSVSSFIDIPGNYFAGEASSDYEAFPETPTTAAQYNILVFWFGAQTSADIPTGVVLNIRP